MPENTLPAGSTNIQGLSPWAAPYITGYLGQAQALGNAPYQVYQGPQTAGTAALQQAAFQGIGNLAVPQALMQSTDQLSDIVKNLGAKTYQPVGVSFTGGAIPTAQSLAPPISDVLPIEGPQYKEGMLGGMIGAGKALPWQKYTQEVKTAGPVAPPPGIGPGTNQPTPPYPTYPDTQDKTLSPTPGSPYIGNQPISKLNDLYQQFFGKAGDEEGMKFWQNKFGNEIDQNELREFLTSGLNVIQSQGGQASVALLDQLRGLGLDPRQQQNITQQAKSGIADLYKTYLGKTAEDEGSHYWASRFGNTIEPNELLAFLQSAQTVLKGQNKEVPKSITDKIAELTKANTTQTSGDAGASGTGQAMTKEDELRAAFRSTPGANPNPTDEDIAHYMKHGGAEQMAKDVAAIRASNPELARQIDLARQKAGLDKTVGGGTTTQRARGGITAYADGGAVSSGVTSNQGIGSLPYGQTAQSTPYNTPAATGSASTALGNVNATTPMASQAVSGIAQQYMNPYLQASLAPQYEELRRQSQINLQPSLAKLTQAGGLGGGRQAIMESEAQRNLLQSQQNLLGQGYNTAFNTAQQQFNTEQDRAIREAQFGATYGLNAAQQQAQAAQAMGQLGLSQNQAQLANLNLALTGGGTQRDIEQQGITADYNEFLKQLQYPYQQVQFQRDMLTGLPVSTIQNQPAQLSGLAALIGAVGGIGNLSTSLANPNLQTLLGNLGLGGLFGSSGNTNP